ncbi:MAG: PH domain-containing protein [Planctomycetia bacterium]|nr:PH domain-containing protein [Planctomycetia bacterium]
MIYEAIKGLLLAVLQAPHGPPEPPVGSPGSVQLFRAARQYLHFRLLVTAIVFAVLTLIPALLAVVLYFDRKAPGAAVVVFALAASGFALGGVAAWFITRLEYDMRYYLITDRSLRIREGVLTITEVTLTYANVQHLEISQGPIGQMLGIANLVVRTAGGSGMAAMPNQPGAAMIGHRGNLKGIDNAEEIRDLINGHLKRFRQAGLGDPEERHRSQPKIGPMSPTALARLREIRDELRAWRSRGDTRIQG